MSKERQELRRVALEHLTKVMLIAVSFGYIINSPISLEVFVIATLIDPSLGGTNIERMCGYVQSKLEHTQVLLRGANTSSIERMTSHRARLRGEIQFNPYPYSQQ